MLRSHTRIEPKCLFYIMCPGIILLTLLVVRHDNGFNNMYLSKTSIDYAFKLSNI